MQFEIDSVSRIIQDTAAETILPRFRRLKTAEVHEKSSGELVTVADEETEERLERRLRGLLPGSKVLGEEATARDARLFGLLDREQPVWVIDPVDGTGNFAAGREPFAVMVALVRQGETLAAWIHDPVAGRTATAEPGSGAYLDGKRLAVAGSASVKEMRGTLNAGQFASRELRRRIERRRERVGQVKSLRCAGAEYLRLSQGDLHFAFFSKLMPWDHAPGTLLFREAGGIARLLDGRDYDATRRDGAGLLMAPDAESWAALHDALFRDD